MDELETGMSERGGPIPDKFLSKSRWTDGKEGGAGAGAGGGGGGGGAEGWWW